MLGYTVQLLNSNTIQHVYTFVYTVQHVYLSSTFGAKGSATKKLSHEGIELVRLEIYGICTVDTYMQYCLCLKGIVRRKLRWVKSGINQ
jgi:hypothetical protein